MDIKGKVIVITGAASGIGKALAERFHQEGARALILGDLNEAGVKAVAASVGGIGMKTDVTKEADVQALAKAAEDQYGRVDLFCSNAGISVGDVDPNNAAATGDEGW